MSCCIQVWASSAYGALPSSASLYASTTSIFGPKSPLGFLDWGHWSLMSGLVVVSAMYLWRENGLSARERLLRRELSNSQAEIAKLIMKVITKLQGVPVPSWRAGTCCCKLYVSGSTAVVVALQVVNMQHSMQSPGRVPIIRHTCSVSTVTPFPSIHLV